MKNIVMFGFAFVFSVYAKSQSNTEVFLFDFIKSGDSYSINDPINISSAEGYNNQPSFLHDGSGVLFASTRNNQTDIAIYHINTQTKTWLTNTPGSEYSPMQSLDRPSFTAVRLDEDGTQLLWEYSFEGNKQHVLVENLKIGYYTWYNEETVVSFVLGTPATLQISNLITKKNWILNKNIGRSIHKIPKTNLISFISLEGDIPKIYSMNPITVEKEIIANTFEEFQDMAWVPDGTIITGKGSKLYKLTPGLDDTWVEFASLESYKFNDITRLAVSPLGNKIAIVVETK